MSRILRLGCLLIATTLLYSSVVAAVESAVTFEAFPAAPVATVDGRATTRLLVQNGEVEPIEVVSVDELVDRSATACVSAIARPTPAGAACPRLAAVTVEPSAVLTLWLTIDGIEPAHGATVQLVLAYERETGEASIPGIQTLTVVVDAVAAATAPASAASVSLESAIAALTEGRHGLVYLSVTNTSGLPITSVEMTARVPADMTLSWDECPNGAAGPGVTCGTYTSAESVAPGASRTYPVRISTPQRVLPGKQVLVFDVVVTTLAGQHSSSVLTHDIEIGVYGESAILGLLEIPILFLVPGVLFLVFLGMVLKLLGREVAALPTAITEVKMWALAVPLSFLLVVAYGRIWPPPATNDGLPSEGILGAHNLGDIGRIWAVAAVAAAVAGLIWWMISPTTRASVRVWWTTIRNVIQPRDQPLETLQKLGRVDLGLVLPRVRDAEGRTAFLVGEGLPASKGDVTIIPKMLIRLPYPGDGIAAANHDAIKNQLRSDGSPDTLATLLKEGGGASVRWAAGIRETPRKISSEGLAQLADGLIASLETEAPERTGGPA